MTHLNMGLRLSRPTTPERVRNGYGEKYTRTAVICEFIEGRIVRRKGCTVKNIRINGGEKSGKWGKHIVHYVNGLPGNQWVRRI